MLHIHSSVTNAIINVTADSVVKRRVSAYFPSLPELTTQALLGVPCHGRWTGSYASEIEIL